MELPPGSIFICYRHDDSADVAGRIYDRLVAHFGREGVYRDVDAIPIGVDFRNHIQNCLNRCQVGLVIIGRNWINAALPDGTIRLEDPADHVRIEIETMFSRELPVVPVYVGGAETLRTNQLTESLHELAYRNGVPVRRDPDFHRDMDRLLTNLQTIFTEIELRERKKRERDEATRRIQEENEQIEAARKIREEHEQAEAARTIQRERERAESSLILSATTPAQRRFSLPNLFFDLAAKLSGASLDLAVDLGTAYTSIYKKGHGICLREPSIVATADGTGRVHAVGNEAHRILAGRPAGFVIKRAIKDGVVMDISVVAAMLKRFIANVREDAKGRLRLIIAVPTGISQVEKDAAREVGRRVGAREVFLIEQTMAAAIGVGLPIQDSAPSVIVNIGAGMTEVALISLSAIAFSRSVRVAGDELDDAILQYMKRAYNLIISARTAETIKIKTGSAYPSVTETSVEVKGRDLVAGLPKTLTITSQEVREALLEPISTIIESVSITLERCPPELSADLVERGLVLAGGGALLRGFDRLLCEETGLPIHVAEDPTGAVADGAGRCLNHLELLLQVARNGHAWR